MSNKQRIRNNAYTFNVFVSNCSNTGKRLMAKCRMLYQENEELGKTISSGRLAKLEAECALHISITHEMKNSQSGST